MTTSTFLEMLKIEVARMQAAHPDREGEISRACALISQGFVTDLGNGEANVLSSDLQHAYRVNGSCNCPGGQHGKDCKHQHAWKLYQYVARKVAAQEPAPVELPQEMDVYPDNDCEGDDPEETVPMPQPTPAPQHHEAPASVNVRITIQGREVQWTLRDTDEERLAVRLEALLARYPQPPAPPSQQLSPQQHNAAAMHKKVTDFCPVHNVAMKENTKDGRRWWSHFDEAAGRWCKGR